MNYYEHHIGDYAEATGHLSIVEDGAYSRLIRKYYASEKPLPAEIKSVQRLVGAKTKQEREAVVAILREFFSLEQDGWHNARCDEELEAYHAGEPEREARRHNAATRLKLHREERVRLFEGLRHVGITPPWNIKMEDLKRLHETHCNGLQRVSGALHPTGPETPDTATQSPVPSPHPPVSNPNPVRERGASVIAESFDAWKGIPGLDEQAMTEWLAHRAIKKPPDGLRPHERIAVAKMLAGMGTPERQRTAVQLAIANGWNNLRHTDADAANGSAPRKSSSSADRVKWEPDPEEERAAQERAAGGNR